MTQSFDVWLHGTEGEGDCGGASTVEYNLIDGTVEIVTLIPCDCKNAKDLDTHIADFDVAGEIVQWHIDNAEGR